MKRLKKVDRAGHRTFVGSAKCSGCERWRDSV